MATCVEIEIDDDGSVSVGLQPAEAAGDKPDATDPQAATAPAAADAQPSPSDVDDEGAEKQYMKPARNVEDALRQARQMLMSAQSATQAPQGGARESAQTAFDAGFQGVRGGGS